MEKSHKNKLKIFFDKLNTTEITFSFDAEKFFSGKKLYIFAFFIPVIILFASYMIMRIYPAGNKSVLIYDLYGMYAGYYENFRDAVWENRSLIISWSRNLSGEMFGIFVGCMMSPFMLTIFLLPRSMITEAILIAQLLKVGTISVTFSIYLRHSKKAPSCTALIFSLMYSLMAYAVVHLVNPMWMEAIMLLPLICWGIERLIDEGKMLGFIIPLFLAIIANYYIAWMIVIFCCLYFLAYYFFISDSEPSFRLIDIFRCGVKFASAGILAAICSLWLLIPSYFSLSQGKLGLSEQAPDIPTNFNLLDFFISLLPNSYDTIQRGGSPLAYCGVITMLLIPMYFFNSSIPLRKRLGFGILTAVLILSMFIYQIDIIWHGFQPPFGVPYRYAFLLGFVLLVMAVQAFEKMDGIDYKKIGAAFFLILGYVMYAEKISPVTIDMDGGEHERIHLVSVVLFTIFMLSVYAVLLYFHKKFYGVKPVPVIIAVFTAAELMFTTSATLDLVSDDLRSYVDRSSYNRYVELGRDTVNKIYDMDEDLYRIEKGFMETMNDNMTLGIFGISHGSSNVNTAMIQFLRSLGFPFNRYYVTYRGSTYVTDSVFGIKYVIERKSADSGFSVDTENDTDPGADDEESAAINFLRVMLAGKSNIDTGKSTHYDNIVLTNGDSKETFYVYENPYALPVAFMADDAIADASFGSWENVFENQNTLLSALISDEKQDFFKRISTELITENLEYSRYEDHDRYKVSSENGQGRLSFEFTAPTDDMIYMYLPADYDYRRTLNLWLNDEFLDQYFPELKTSVIPLGRHEGEKLSLNADIVSSQKEVFFKDAYFYYLDEKMFAEAIEELKRQPLEIESFKEDHIRGTVTAEKDGILFTSIAWEPGWTVLVDGEKTEPVKLVDALIGIPVSEGTHTIEMKFFPAGLAWGTVLSAAGIAAVVIIGILENKKRKVLS